MVLLVDVIIGPRATVPMGTQEIALLDIRIDTCYDICGGEHRTIPALQIGFLGNDSTAIALELVDNPLSSLLMRLRVHCARAKLALLSTKDIGTVFTEGRTTKGYLILCHWFFAFAPTKYDAQKENYIFKIIEH